MVRKNYFFLIFIFICRNVFCMDLLAKFHQSDFKLRDLRTEVPFINKSILYDFDVIGHKYNRTTTAFNFTIYPKFDLGDKVEVVVQGFKRASNEYRLFPLRFQINYCKGIQSNVLGAKSLPSYGNYSTCFWKKDTLYASYNFVIDESNLPPYLPHGEYKAQCEFFFLKDKMAVLNALAEVYSPMVADKKKHRK